MLAVSWNELGMGAAVVEGNACASAALHPAWPAQVHLSSCFCNTPLAARCPACGAAPLTEEEIQIVRKPGRRSTRDAAGGCWLRRVGACCLPPACLRVSSGTCTCRGLSCHHASRHPARALAPGIYCPTLNPCPHPGLAVLLAPCLFPLPPLQTPATVQRTWSPRSSWSTTSSGRR